MGKVNIVLPDDVEEVLRKHVPGGRGYLSKFITEAVIEKLKREGVLDE